MSTEVDAAASAPTTDGFSKEYVDSLKAQLEAKNEEAAKLRAFKSGHDERARAAIAKMQPDINEYVAALAASNPEQAAEMQPIVDWGKTCHESSSLDTAMPLARVISCASAQYKRTREEASVLSEKANSLGATMKELEEIKADRDAKMNRISELESLCNERQLAAEKMQEELARAGIIKDKFDFSKLSSREAKAVETNDQAKKVEVKTEGLTASTSHASRGRVEDELMTFVMGSANNNSSSNRIGQSATSHAYLGATGGSVDSEIASAIRSGGVF